MTDGPAPALLCAPTRLDPRDARERERLRERERWIQTQDKSPLTHDRTPPPVSCLSAAPRAPFRPPVPHEKDHPPRPFVSRPIRYHRVSGSILKQRPSRAGEVRTRAGGLSRPPQQSPRSGCRRASAKRRHDREKMKEPPKKWGPYNVGSIPSSDDSAASETPF